MSDDTLLGLGYAGTTRELRFVRLQGDSAASDAAEVAEEVPVALVYNGRPHAVMLATPADLEDFAVGFSLSESIVGHVARIEDVQVARFAAGIELQVTIPAEDAERLERRTRRLAGRTGCGLCGVEQISEALRLPERPLESALVVRAGALWLAAEALEGRQPVNAATRAVHAAAFASAEGELLEVREDIGRHNALDKTIGALARTGRGGGGGFALVTSRASVEMVQKTAAAGIPLLAAVSRPTTLAVRVAEAAGVALVGLLRGTSANVYAHAERVRTG